MNFTSALKLFIKDEFRTVGYRFRHSVKAKNFTSMSKSWSCKDKIPLAILPRLKVILLLHLKVNFANSKNKKKNSIYSQSSLCRSTIEKCRFTKEEWREEKRKTRKR